MKRFLLLTLAALAVTIAVAQAAQVQEQTETFPITATVQDRTFGNCPVWEDTRHIGLLGEMKPGKQVTVYGVEGFHARIDFHGQTGYVSCSDLGIEPDLSGIDLDNIGSDISPTLILVLQYLFFAVGAALCVIRLKGYNYTTYRVAMWLFGAMIAIELAFGYFYLDGYDAPTFDWADQFPYLLKVLTALVLAACFAFMLFVQFVVFMSFIEDIKFTTGKNFSVRFGLLCWGISVLALLVCDRWFYGGEDYVYLFYLATLLAQIVVIMWRTRPKYGSGLLASALTAVTPLAISLYLMRALPEAFDLLLGAFGVYFVCSSFKHMGSSSPSYDDVKYPSLAPGRDVRQTNSGANCSNCSRNCSSRRGADCSCPGYR